MAKPAEIAFASLLAALVPACMTDTSDVVSVDLHDQAVAELGANASTPTMTATWRFDAGVNWPEDSTLHISLRAVDKAHDLRFVMIDESQQRPIRCIDAKDFRDVAIDLLAGTVRADGTTYTFAQCGLEDWPSVAVFPMTADRGSPQQTIESLLDAKLERR